MTQGTLNADGEVLTDATDLTHPLEGIVGLMWIPVEERLPETQDTVLVFSPVYPAGHAMRFRLMDGGFVRICTEAACWIAVENLTPTASA